MLKAKPFDKFYCVSESDHMSIAVNGLTFESALC